MPRDFSGTGYRNNKGKHGHKGGYRPKKEKRAAATTPDRVGWLQQHWQEAPRLHLRELKEGALKLKHVSRESIQDDEAKLSLYDSFRQAGRHISRQVSENQYLMRNFIIQWYVGLTLAHVGLTEEALPHLKKAYQLAPNRSKENNVSTKLSELGQPRSPAGIE